MRPTHSLLVALSSLFAFGCAVEFSTGLSLDTFSKDPDAVDVSAGLGDKVVTCDLTITGQGGAGGSGTTVRDAGCVFKSPSGSKATCLAASAVGDVWSCDVTILESAEDGTWTIDYVFVRDMNDPPNQLLIPGAELVADVPDVMPTAGEVDLAVTSTTQDTTPPTITAFDPVSQDVYPGSPVQCRILTDEDPVEVIGCTFLPDDASASISCISEPGSNTCNADVPGAVDVGVTYNEVNHFARDSNLNVTVKNANQTFVVVAPPTTGNIAVDMSALPGACTVDANFPLWSIDPGGLSGKTDLSPTPVAPGDYTITWLDSSLPCTNPTTELKAVVVDTTTTFELGAGGAGGSNYTARSTFASVNTNVGVDGNYGEAPPGGGAWTMAAGLLPSQFAASGTGDVTDVVPTTGDFYVGRDYTLNWGPEVDHTAPAPVAITTSGTYQGNYIDLSPGGCDSKVADISTSGDAWVDGGVQTQANALLTFESYVRASSVQTIVAVSNAAATTFNDATMLVRINDAGNFDAYDTSFGGYDADATIQATLDVWHKITISADVQAGTYSVDIGTCDESQTTLIENAVFRNAPLGDGMYYYNLWSYTGTAELELSEWTPGACTPDVCNGAPFECGTPDDGCGTPLACGDTCTGGDVCFPEGTCCPPSTTVCTDPNPDYECGDWSDGCGSTVDCNPGAGGAGGGTLSCDDRNPGDFCNGAGQCETPPASGAPYAHVKPSDVGVTIGVGVTAPIPTVVYTGPNPITQDGTTLENVIINGTLTIQADNVTVRNCIINADGLNWGLNFETGSNGLFEYNRINKGVDGKQVRFGPGTPDYPPGASGTFRRNESTGGTDFFWLAATGPTQVLENYVHHMETSGDSHIDAFQGYPVGLITIRGNYFAPSKIGPGRYNAAMFIEHGFGPYKGDVIYESNYIAEPWGGWILRVWQDAPTATTIRYNIFHDDFQVWFNDEIGPPESPDRAVFYQDNMTAPYATCECNRYEDGTFIEQSNIVSHGDPVTHVITGCPSYTAP